MRMLTAHLENFRSAAELDVDFREEGLTAIIGAPGSGKSSIFAGLMFSLYGVAGPDQDLLDVRYDRAADKSVVVADYVWTHDGTEYRTRRELRRGVRKGAPVEKSSAQMWRGGIEVDNMTPTEMTKQVTAILGMSDRSYAGSSLIRQGEVDTLTTATPSVVQQLVEDHTGIGIITKARDATRKRANEARAIADAMPGSLDEVQTSAAAATEAATTAANATSIVDAAKSNAERARRNWQDSDATANRLRRSQINAQTSRDAVTSASGALDAARTSAEAADAAAAALGITEDTNLNDLTEQLERWAQQRATLANAGNTVYYAAGAATSATRDHVTAQSASDTATAHRDRTVAALNTLSDRLTQLNEQLENSRVAAAAARADSARLDKALTTLTGAAAHCPTCLQSLDDADALVATLTDQRNRARTAATKAEHLAGDVTTSIATVREQITSTRGDLDQMDKLVAAAAQAQDRAKHARSELAAATTHCQQVLGTAVSDAEDAIAKIGAAIASVDAQRDTAGEQRGAITAARTAWEQVASATARLDKARVAVSDAPDPAAVEDAITRAAEQRVTADALAADAADAAANAHGLQVAASQLQAAAESSARQWEHKQQAVRDAEIADTTAELLTAYRQDLIGDFCEGISAAATELLERFGGEHVAFHLDPTFVPRVELADGRLRKTSSLSGGEKARVGLAFRLGISMQITDGGLPDQIIGDEITQYLDDDGRRQVVATISDLFASPILVSHTAEILDYATLVHRVERTPLGATTLADTTA